MIKAALYARYSSDNQSVASIEDQFRVCQEHAAREKGKAGGGLCYGYRVVKKFDAAGEPIRGEREIIEEEAKIVRRIFREFASGKSPIAIATDLNRDGVPGPFGQLWGDTTIRGHVSRGTGLLHNELYVGVLVWNRLRYVKDPNTGKRVSRPNPESEWIRTEVPALRIVDDALWQAMKARQAELTKLFEPTILGVRAARAKQMHKTHSPAFLLSGLLTCGICKGRYSIVSAERYGCRNHFRRGACDSGRTITRRDIESRIMVGLKDKLISPESVERAARAFYEVMNRENHEQRAQAVVDRQMLGKIERSIQSIVKAIEDGMYQPVMKARMVELEAQKAEIEARLKEAPANMPDIHPNVAELYRKQIAHLTGLLDDPELSREAAQDIRSLIGEIILTPGEKRGEVKVVLNGEFMEILEFAAGRREIPFRSRRVIPSVVAGPRNHRYRDSSFAITPASVRMSGFFAARSDGRMIAGSALAFPPSARSMVVSGAGFFRLLHIPCRRETSRASADEPD